MKRDIQSKLYTRKGDDIHNIEEFLIDDTQSFQKKQIMAILNCTPDSFYDGGSYFSAENAIRRGLEMIDEGADLIDIGGESTRPLSTPVSIAEEIRRTKEVIKALHGRIPLSIDSSKPEVVEMALDQGVSFINDVTGFQNLKMRELAKRYQATLCLMHMQKTPQTMQESPHYPRGVVIEVYEWLQKEHASLLDYGIAKEKIYIDVGIGFGKSVPDNLSLLKNLALFSTITPHHLIGLSRKSFMQKILKKTASELLSTTVALNTMSLLKGVEIIRVHDVKEHKEMLSLLESIEVEWS